MCGISGYYGKYSEQGLKKMIYAQKHRGPDSQGYELFKNANVGLGHNRLAIIDLSERGKQPMFNEDKTICIVFNGEIYNFEEVKSKLKYKHNFFSASDTETIVHAYEEWGPDCLQKFNGMFAFVIYDSKKDLLFGARDRLGEKPLKYHIDSNGIVFASELKALLQVIKQSPELDPIAINHFLTFQYVPSPLTGFKDIFKLPPAHYFIYKNGKMNVTKYWNLDFASKEQHTENEWEKIVLHELERSVKDRMISDVPIGALLSGGIDSSAVVAFMARNSKTKINTYSIGFNNAKYDETAYAKIVANKYETNHTVLEVTSDDLVNLLPTLMDYYDEPIADNSILPTFLVSKLTRQHVTVALDGDGGDENFAGYDRYNIVDFDQNITARVPKVLQAAAALTTKKIYNLYGTKFTERLSRYFGSYDQPFYKKYTNYNCFFTNSTKQSLYTNEFQELTKNEESFDQYKDLYDSKLSLIDNALKIDQNTYLPDNLLYKTDTAAMSNSLELRAPFLDHKLMEVCAKIPSSLKIKNMEKKYILKKALLNSNILPKEIIYRKKRGFNIPQNAWFKTELKDYIHDTTLSASFMDANIFDKSRLKEYIDSYYETNLNYDNNIFALISLAKWVETYL